MEGGTNRKHEETTKRRLHDRLGLDRSALKLLQRERVDQPHLIARVEHNYHLRPPARHW